MPWDPVAGGQPDSIDSTIGHFQARLLAELRELRELRESNVTMNWS